MSIQLIPEPERLSAEKKLRQYKTRAAGEGFMPRLFPADKREGEGFIVLIIYSWTYAYEL